MPGATGGSPAPVTTTAKATTTLVTSTKATTTAAAQPTTTAGNGGGSGSGAAQKYGQCGGNGWTGPTTCVSGSTCTKVNDWYSQCL